jgi:aspartyl-tRNA(Asn)/glutamyl-tRNA(Gln) amidotransferase subunit C
MSKVSVETLDHVARLARLHLTEAERQTFARQLADILSFAQSIQQLDLELVEPMSHALEAEALREDTPLPSLPRELVTEAGPDTAAGLFRVPRIL